jgi:G3E family GTPase
MNRVGIHVYLISGFLGCGKTTFLNHVLKDAPSDVKLLVMMNEFGEEGIDGALVQDPELEIVEINKGSIFCACVKGDFIKALYRIAFVIRPEVLIVEASGVANPADMGRIIFNPLYEGRFTHLENVCIVDAANFLEQYDIFTAVEKQIEASRTFIVNKTDLVEPSTLHAVKGVILRHTPQATFVETSFARVEVSRLPGFASWTEAVVSERMNQEKHLLENDALEEILDRILEDEAAQATPPDLLFSVALRWPPGSVEAFRHVADHLPPDVVRAKGFVFANGRHYLYSHVGHSYEIVPFKGLRALNKSFNRAVFIRTECKDEDLRSMFTDQGLDLLRSPEQTEDATGVP